MVWFEMTEPWMKQTQDEFQPRPFVMPQATSDLWLVADMNQNDRLTRGSNKSLWPGNNRVGDPNVWREAGHRDSPVQANPSQGFDEVWRWLLHQSPCPVSSKPGQVWRKTNKKKNLAADSPSFGISLEKPSKFPVRHFLTHCSPSLMSRDLLMFSTNCSRQYKQPVRLWRPYRGGLQRSMQ